MVSPMISDKLFSWFLGGASRVSSSQAVIAPWGVVFGRKTKLKWTYHRRKFQRGSKRYLLCGKSWSCKPLSDIFFRTSHPRFSAICILIVQNAIGIQIMPTKTTRNQSVLFFFRNFCFVMWQRSVAEEGNVKLLKCSKAPSFC